MAVSLLIASAAAVQGMVLDTAAGLWDKSLWAEDILAEDILAEASSAAAVNMLHQSVHNITSYHTLHKNICTISVLTINISMSCK